MTLVISEKEKNELKDHISGQDTKLSYFQYKQLHYLYCIHESLVSIAHNLEDIVNEKKLPEGFTKIIKR